MRAILWDLRLQMRYRILTVAAFITALYCALFQLLPASTRPVAAVVLIFSDPTTIGFIFVGVLVLFERAEGTLQAVIVSPLSELQYLWSKAISLTLVSVGCSVVMACVARGGIDFNVGLLVLGTALSSIMFVFVGIVGVVRVRSVNAYLVIVPQFLIPLALPLIPSLGIFESPLFYAIPTMGSIVLMDGSMGGRTLWELVYGVVILVAAISAAQWAALRAFERHVRRGGG